MAKTINDLAFEVLEGKWGSGATRKSKLTKAGYDYKKVQARVNDILKKKLVDTIAKEVINGKWGSGETRKKRLKLAGYNYNAVQKRVNEILNPPKPKPKRNYTGKYPAYRLIKTNAKVKADAIKWAKWIAGDNDFHYGYGKHSHHCGCFFCGTQSMKKGYMKMWETTYCCNPFVTAALAHGGGDTESFKKCASCRAWDFGTGSGSYHTSKLFDKLGKPSTDKLQAGDILCGDSHVALYIGGGKVVQAGHSDDNVIGSNSWKSSISIGTWGGWKRAYRYNSKVDCDRTISHGEVSDRVIDLQKYLDWYFNGKVGSADGCFGDNTLKWVKEFQKKELGSADGIVGPKTINAMKKVKK